MYAEAPEPADYPELTDADNPAVPEDPIAALSDAGLIELLDDLHERAAGLTRQRAAALEPTIAAFELEAIRRGIARPAVTEPATRPPVMHRLRKAAASGDINVFRRALRVMDAAGLFHAYVLALEWPESDARASAVTAVFWALTERIDGLGAALDRANRLAGSGLSRDEQVIGLRRHIENTFVDLIFTGEHHGRRVR